MGSVWVDKVEYDEAPSFYEILFDQKNPCRCHFRSTVPSFLLTVSGDFRTTILFPVILVHVSDQIIRPDPATQNPLNIDFCHFVPSSCFTFPDFATPARYCYTLVFIIIYLAMSTLNSWSGLNKVIIYQEYIHIGHPFHFSLLRITVHS
jgi:hypothetical protein